MPTGVALVASVPHGGVMRCGTRHTMAGVQYAVHRAPITTPATPGGFGHAARYRVIAVGPGPAADTRRRRGYAGADVAPGARARHPRRTSPTGRSAQRRTRRRGHREERGAPPADARTAWVHDAEPDGPRGPPAVYGEPAYPGATRTVVFYAHYDGQPVTPRTGRPALDAGAARRTARGRCRRGAVEPAAGAIARGVSDLRPFDVATTRGPSSRCSRRSTP